MLIDGDHIPRLSLPGVEWNPRGAHERMRGIGQPRCHNNLIVIHTNATLSLDVVKRNYVKMLSPGRVKQRSDGATPTLLHPTLLIQTNHQQWRDFCWAKK
jgi:hypothetical protein